MEDNLIRVCEYVKDMGVYWKSGVLSLSLEDYQRETETGRKLLACSFSDPLGYELPQKVEDFKA